MSAIDRAIFVAIAIGILALVALEISDRQTVYDRAIENRLTNTALQHIADIAAGTCANPKLCKGE